jgi:hypothetical protein
MQTPQNRQNPALTNYLASYQNSKPSFIDLPTNPLDMALNVQLWVFCAGLTGGLFRWGIDTALTTYKPLEVGLAGGLISFLCCLIFTFFWKQYPEKQKVLLLRLFLLGFGIAIGSY